MPQPAAAIETKRALIYCRNSHGVGRSIDEQETEGREQCELEGWDVAYVITDEVGASRHTKRRRAGWEQAKQLVASQQVDVLVTWEASRAQRDLEVYAELRRLCAETGVLWSYSGRTYDLTDHDDRFRTGLDALLAENEADVTARRVQRAMRHSALQGRPPGRRLYGYQRTYDAASGRLLGQEPHPDEAPIIQRIYRDYLGGLGVRTIARNLNDEGLTTASRVRHPCSPVCRDQQHPGVPFAQWSDTTVHAILTNPSYIAKRIYRGEILGDAAWPPLVTADQFERVAARLAMKRTWPTRQTRTANLLSGVGRCGVCGAKVHRGHDRNHRKTYLCKDKYCVARDLVKLDTFVSAIVVERLSRPDVAHALDSRTDAEQTEVDVAAARVRELRTQLDAAVDEFTEGRLTAATLAKIETKINAEIATAEATVRRASLPLDLDVPTSDVSAWWEQLSPEVRREVVATLFAAVVILPAKRGSRTFDPDCVRIEWRR